MKIYSYIVAKDYGLAPNPYWGELTLNVCKPKIRQSAVVGDWDIGTGAKNAKNKNGVIKDYSGRMVYPMRVPKKMTMEEYDSYCKENLSRKIPFVDRENWKRIIGDSIYDYSQSGIPKLRKVLHKEEDKKRDLSGKYTLLSTDFYYFGNATVEIPEKFKVLIKNEQGHKVNEDAELNQKFTHWLVNNFESNKLYGEPQLQWQLIKGVEGEFNIKCD